MVKEKKISINDFYIVRILLRHLVVNVNIQSSSWAFLYVALFYWQWSVCSKLQSNVDINEKSLRLLKFVVNN